MIKLKKSVRNFVPYYINTGEYKVKLDANESPNYLLDKDIDINKLLPNIYPDSDAIQLRKNMAKFYGCDYRNIIVGNGSSDIIDFIISSYCEVGDKVLTYTPTFSMYKVYTDLAEAILEEVPAEDDYSVDINKFISRYQQDDYKVVLFCNPNNPTGYTFTREEVVNVIEAVTDSILIIDEAYIEFGGESIVDLINEYENLIVCRTMSKAFGLAGLRVGCMIANEILISDIWRVKMPYNLNAASQLLANVAFERVDEVEAYTKGVVERREALKNNLTELGITVYQSGCNFLFVESNIENLFEKLTEQGIFIRSFRNGTYRITVGTEKENEMLLSGIRRILNAKK